jgi:hypothetical protein
MDSGSGSLGSSSASKPKPTGEKTMDLTNEAAVGGSEPIANVVAPAPAGEKPLGPREAARNLFSWRHDKEKLKWHPIATGQRQDREDDPPVPEQVATDGADVGERETPADGARERLFRRLPFRDTLNL